MLSKVFTVLQIDDIDAAASELLHNLSGFTLQKNTVGILFCYSDMEVSELVNALKAKADFDIIGCTGIATMEQIEGFHEMAATLLILTSDDQHFSTAVSDPITPANVTEQIGSTYKAALTKLTAAPNLLFVLPPYQLETMLDVYSKGFNKIAPGVPVIGGLPSYNSAGDENLTFLNNTISSDRLVLLAVSGDLQPVFTVQNVLTNDASRKRTVTKSSANTVYEVGGQPFTDYLKDIGLAVDELNQGNQTITFVSNPLLLENAANDENNFSFARTLHELNLEDGSGTAIGEIPQGATLSVCTLKRDEIEKAALQGIRDLKEKMQMHTANGYTYTTVLAVSCIGRHLLMLPHNDAEVKQLLSEFPEGLTLAGFYSYGELGPQGESHTQNFAHNESLILCAF